MLSNSFNNSALDHCDWQNKVFYVKDWEKHCKEEEKPKIREYIKNNNCVAVEDIIDGTIKWHYTLKNGEKRERGVFLTTRWNCRHFFTPITINEALNLNKTIEDKKLNDGKYKPENYKALQTQRALEREIRALKSRKLIIQEQLKYATNNHTLKRDLKEINARIKECDMTLETLCKRYNLPRQYNREDVERLTYDLGIGERK